MRLEALQQQMHAAVKDLRPVAEVAAVLGVDPARLAIYRRMVRAHVFTALSSRLPATLRLLGITEGSALYEAYLAAHPPREATLPEAAAAFPGFLAQRLEAGDASVTAFGVALAELEWALFQVNRDPTPLPEWATLAGPVLNPTLQVMAWPWPVGSYLTAHNRGQEGEVPAPAEELVLLFRRPASGNPCFYVGTPERLFVIKMVHEGLSVEAAARLGDQAVAPVAQALASAVEIGLVLAP